MKAAPPHNATRPQRAPRAKTSCGTSTDAADQTRSEIPGLLTDLRIAYQRARSRSAGELSRRRATSKAITIH
jgi:hypothetical protein